MRKFFQKSILLLLVASTFLACELLENEWQKRSRLAWEEVLKNIRTPSTAKKISSHITCSSYCLGDYYDIRFDAQNDYGAVIRSRALVWGYVDKNTRKYVISPYVNIGNDTNNAALVKATGEIFMVESINRHEKEIVIEHRD